MRKGSLYRQVGLDLDQCRNYTRNTMKFNRKPKAEGAKREERFIGEITLSLRRERNLCNYFVSHFIGMCTSSLAACKLGLPRQKAQWKTRSNKYRHECSWNWDCLQRNENQAWDREATWHWDSPSWMRAKFPRPSSWTCHQHACGFEQAVSPAEFHVLLKTLGALGSSMTDPWTGKSLARVPSWALEHAQNPLTSAQQVGPTCTVPGMTM